MANTASRLSANGSLTISGYFDEVSRPFSDNGLVSHWDGRRSFYIGQGTDDTWYDIKANNNIKLYYGANYTPGNVNFYLANASYGLVTIPQVATSSFVTIEGVIKSPISGGMFFGFGAYDVYTAGNSLGYNTAQSNVYGISSAQITSLGITNKYTHYAFVMVGLGGDIPTSNEIWINGVKQTLSNILGTTTTNTRGFNNYGDYGFLLNGWAISSSYRDYKNDISFANLRIYNRKLDANEIVQNYNLVAPNFGLTQISAPLVTKTTANNIIINGEFDEVTYNPTANVRVNTLSNSQQFNLSPWSVGGATVTADVIVAPDGTTTGFSLNENTNNGEHLVYQSRTGRDETMTASYYAKAAVRTRCYISLSNFLNFSCQVHYDLIAGTITLVSGNNSDYSNISGTITPVGNGWFRCTLTATKGSVNSTNGFTIAPVVGASSVYLGTGVPAIYIWGAQYEQSASPSIYVRTGTNAIIANTFNQRTVNTGNTYVRGTYDEYSKMSPITEGLIFNIDPGYEGSYVGSGAAMYDTTQNRYRVDLNNSPTYSSDFGGILKFTSTFGNNAWGNTSIPSRIITTTSNYTMSAWVKCNPTMKGLAETSFYNLATSAIVSPQANTGYSYGSTGSILGNSYFGGYGLFWSTRVNNNGVKELSFGLSNRINSPSTQFSSSSQTVTLNNSAVFLNWTHIVGVYNSSGNFCGFYVNGVLVNSTTTSQMSVGSFPFTTSTLRICWDSTTGGSPTGRNFDGDTGPMSIWNRALSASEIQQMYNSQRGRFGV